MNASRLNQAQNFIQRLLQSSLLNVGWLLDASGVYRRLAPAGCGHQTRLFGSLEAYGERIEIIGLSKKPLLCFSCMHQLTIRCAWCGKPIFPGDPVTLYSPMDSTYVPNYSATVRHLDNPVIYVGCLRLDCAESGADRAGFWNPPDGVHRVPTAYELVLSNPDKGVIIDDVCNPSARPEFFDI